MKTLAWSTVAFCAGLTVAACTPAEQQVVAVDAAKAALIIRRGEKLCIVIGAIRGAEAAAICDAADTAIAAGLDDLSDVMGRQGDAGGSDAGPRD